MLSSYKLPLWGALNWMEGALLRPDVVPHALAALPFHLLPLDVQYGPPVEDAQPGQLWRMKRVASDLVAFGNFDWAADGVHYLRMDWTRIWNEIVAVADGLGEIASLDDFVVHVHHPFHLRLPHLLRQNGYKMRLWPAEKYVPTVFNIWLPNIFPYLDRRSFSQICQSHPWRGVVEIHEEVVIVDVHGQLKRLGQLVVAE